MFTYNAKIMIPHRADLPENKTVGPPGLEPGTNRL
jgi:hypothetical protein